MSTGYTCKIGEGQTFKDFLLGCARAFGALMSMRDDPADVKISDEFKPSDYHKDALAEVIEKFRKLEKMTDVEKEAAAEKDFVDMQVENARRVKKIWILKRSIW